MANNRIQVKRTSVAGRTANTTDSGNSQYIAAGEFALNMPDGILYTSNGSVLITVGSNVVNQNITGNLTVKAIIANNSIGSAGQTLTSNGSAVYWSAGAGSGTVTQVGSGNGLTGGPITTSGTLSVLANTGIVANTTGLFVNATYIGTLSANNTTFVNGKTEGNLNVNNATTAYSKAESALNVNSALTANNSTNLGGVAAASYQTTAGLSANVATLTANNTSFVGTVSAANVVSNAQLSSNLANYVTTTNLTNNLANYQTTAGLSANVVTLTANNANFVKANNGITSNSLGVFVTQGTGTVVNATGVHVNATYIGTLTANNATNLNGQAASFYTNATNINTGTLPYAQIPANVINTTAAFTRTGITTFSANIVLGSSGLSANGGFGTAGQVLHSNGTAAYWAADDNAGGTVTSVASGNGLTGGPITTTGTLSVLANNGIVSNSTGVFVNAQTPLVANATGLHIATSAGNGTFSSGISAITVDSVGRVTSVTGSAGYVTSSGVTSVATGNGMTGGTITTTGTVSILANTGVVANATGLFVNSTYIGTLSANNTTYVNGKTEGNLNVNNATTAYSKTEGNLNVNNATTAYSATYATYHSSLDGDRDAATKLPTSTGLAVRFDFVGAASAGTGGNYAGLMTYAPWTGTTASTGDASYQLAFGSTAVNGGGIPKLNIRKGIDSTWNAWYTLLHSGNYNDYSPTLTGTGASGTWAITTNNATNLGGVAAASYVQNTDSRTLSGNLVISGTSFTPSSNTVLLGNSTQRWVLSANTGSFSGAVSGITTLAAGNTTITGFVNASTGSITSNGLIYSSNLILQEDGTDAYVRETRSGGHLYLGANNTNHVIIAANGNVGIGNTTPQEKLHVAGAIISSGATAANKTAAVSFDYSSGFGGGRILAWGPVGTNATLTFWSGAGTGGAVERVRIDTSGNVGIGNSTSAHKLRVEGTTSLAGAVSDITTLTTATIELGNASDTTLARSAAGVVTIEGVEVVTLSRSQTLTSKTLTDPIITGAIIEDVYTIVDGAAFEIDPSNGTLQNVTLGASRTPKGTNFVAGESVTLRIKDGTAFTITWTDATFGTGGVSWVGGSAPTLDTTNWTTVVLWKEGTQVYGKNIGVVV